MKELRQQMQEEWQVDEPDEGAILALHREIHEIRGQLAEYRIQLRLDVMAILTPEQREKARARFNARGQRGKGRGGRFMGRGRGFGRGEKDIDGEF